MNIELVWDKSECTLQIGRLTVVAAPQKWPPFHYQAIVEEQDTYLVFDEQTTITDPGKPVWYLASKLERMRVHKLGSVIIQDHAPIRLLAVIHDVDQDPICRTESIMPAYQSVMMAVNKRNIVSLALPLLGTVHGKVPVNESIRFLSESVCEGFPAPLQQLWLILPPGCDCRCLSLLAVRKHGD